MVAWWSDGGPRRRQSESRTQACGPIARITSIERDDACPPTNLQTDRRRGTRLRALLTVAGRVVPEEHYSPQIVGIEALVYSGGS